MIYLIHNGKDISINNVIRLLKRERIGFKSIKDDALINVLDEVTISEKGESEILLRTGDYVRDIDVFWFRRGYLEFKYNYDGLNINDERILTQVSNHLKLEEESLLKYFLFEIQQKSIGSQNRYNQNKLICLKHAALIGFNIPFTFVGKKQYLENRMVAHEGGIVTKNIQDILVLNKGASVVTHETTVVDDSMLHGGYGYSLIQELVAVKYEFRVFVFLDKVYAVTCVNRKSSKIVDIRNSKGNRYTKSKLPLVVENKVRKLTTQLEYETCSIDLLLDVNGKWWFLEINPVGQFDMMYRYGHYNLYDDIVSRLKKFITYD